MLKVVFNKLPKVKDLYKYIKEKENITVSKNQLDNLFRFLLLTI